MEWNNISHHPSHVPCHQFIYAPFKKALDNRNGISESNL